MLIPKSSVGLDNTFYSLSGKNGTLRDKAQYTEQSPTTLVFYDSGNANYKWLISIISMTSGWGKIERVQIEN